jgi:hypothetical protein
MFNLCTYHVISLILKINKYIPSEKNKNEEESMSIDWQNDFKKKIDA